VTVVVQQGVTGSGYANRINGRSAGGAAGLRKKPVTRNRGARAHGNTFFQAGALAAAATTTGCAGRTGFSISSWITIRASPIDCRRFF
jgi:hypothetical protein